MWKAFGTDSDSEESKAHTRYFRPRISSISGALHSLTKQRFHSAIKDEDMSGVGYNTSRGGGLSINPGNIEGYPFDASRINGACLTGFVGPSPTRSSYGELLAHSRSPSARASIDSTAAHAVYDIDLEGDHNSNNEDDATDQANKCSSRARKWCRGIVLTILISFSWVGSFHLFKLCFERGKPRTMIHIIDLNQTINNTFGNIPDTKDDETSKSTTLTKSSTDATFDASFFMAWYSSLWNLLFLPIFVSLKVICFNKDNISTKKMIVESIQQFMERGFSLLQFFTRCGLFCCLWIFSMYFLIFTIRKLDVTVVMALYACSISLMYMLSWVVLHQQFVGIRIVAVIICTTGMALLAYMNGVDRTTLSNVLLAVLACALAAVYKVFYKRSLGYTSFAQTSLFFTLLGFMNALLMWPMVLLLYFTGAETILWDKIPWLYLSGAAALTLNANIMASFGLCWTYEVFLTLGILFAIPISSVIDASIYSVTFEHMKLGGIMLIMFAFLITLLPENWNQYLGNILQAKIAKWKRHKGMKKNGSRIQDTSTAQLSRLRTPSGRVK